jgi:beta-N-acetylglucosaminidase
MILGVEIKEEPVQEEIQVPSIGSNEIIKNYELNVDSDLRNISNLTADEFNKMLSNTNLNGLGYALERAEKEYSVNGLYLMGLACLESAYRYF